MSGPKLLSVGGKEIAGPKAKNRKAVWSTRHTTCTMEWVQPGLQGASNKETSSEPTTHLLSSCFLTCLPSNLQFSGGLWLHCLALCGHRRAQGSRRGLCFQRQGLILGLCQGVDHGHVHVEVMCLLEPPATLIAGKVQLSLCLVLGHVVLERCPLPTLEATDFTLQWLGS